MAAPKLKSAAAAVMLGGAISLGAMGPTTQAEAQQPVVYNQSSLTTVYDTSLKAGGHAGEFGDHINSIGVVVFYGEGEDPIRIGDAFASELQRRGINARSFAAPISGRGASIIYQVGASGLGPLNVNSAAENMSKAVEISRTRDRLLSGQYATLTAQGR